jgi:hypothetical protein
VAAARRPTYPERVRTPAVVLALTFALSAADVFPGACCQSRTVETKAAWEECGAHGPRWILNCEEGLTCFDVKDARTPHPRVCSKRCQSDADCAGLGAGFSCSGAGILGYREDDRAPICARGAR